VVRDTLRRWGRGLRVGRPTGAPALDDVAHERTWALIVPTHTLDGAVLDIVGRRAEFVAALDPLQALPPGANGDTEQLRISGWVVSPSGSPPVVRLLDGSRTLAEQSATLPREGPVPAIDPRVGSEQRGFDLVVPRPCAPDASAELVLELDDGVVFTRRLLHVLPRVYRDGFAGFVETPTDPMVLGHTLQVACFRGWIGAPLGRTCTVRVIPAIGDVVEVVADRARPEVLESEVAEALGLEAAWGFTAFLELPQPLERPLPVVLEFSDGDRTTTSATYFVTPHPDINQLDTFLPDPPAFARLASEHLRGEGLELGALHSPLPVDPTLARVRYADQFDEEHARRHFDPKFAELYGDDLVHVDFIVDLDHDDLSLFAAEDFDFFVACGVLEHLADPLGFLVRLHDVMKPGARFFLAVPDRDFTFDTYRACTTNEHLWDEHQRGITEIPDDHVAEYVELTVRRPLPEDPSARAAALAEHRAAGPHAHVWTTDSFDEFLRWAIERVPLDLDIVGGADAREAEGNIVRVLEKRRA
jgi:hypothetical protein